VADDVLAAQEADDAKLLNLVRTGDSGAFEVLRQRHEQAARRLADELVASAAEANDLVEQTFAQVLDETSHGGGPTDAFRPYLLTALRLSADNGLAAEGSAAPEERSLMAAAFFALPERWIAVLWHTEIESASAVDVAPLLGLTPEGVAALRRRAREGLRQTYLQLHASRVGRPECRPVWEQLGAFIRDPGPGPESALVTEHLSQCEDCRALYADLADVNLALRTLVAPVVLGRATAAYLSGAPHDTAATTAAAIAGADGMAAIAADAAGAGAGLAGWFSAPLTRGSLQPLRLLAAGAVIVVCGAAFAVSLVGHDTPLGSAHHPQAYAATTPPATGTASPTPSQQASARGHVARHSPRKTPAAPPASVTSPGSVSPGPSVIASSAPAVQLTATVSIGGQQGHGHWHSAQVDFQVNDTGSAATRQVTVSITLPAGAWLFGGQGGWHGHGNGGGQGNGGGNGNGGRHWHGQTSGQAADAGDGWSCQPTSTGASCQHSAIAAGGQAQGVIYIGISGSACGQPVGLTASSGSASASAQSPQDLQC
jgi:DNA-directed RNA polymerase specialized sigma24 family protein